MLPLKTRIIGVLTFILISGLGPAPAAEGHGALHHDCAPHISQREVERGVDRESKCRYTAQKVRKYFGPAYHEAFLVMDCEDSWSQAAGVGYHQYHGPFQMGKSERQTWGHGWKIWRAVRAAYRYFAETGYDWSPWGCKP